MVFLVDQMFQNMQRIIAKRLFEFSNCIHLNFIFNLLEIPMPSSFQ